MMREVVLATTNPHKVVELRAVLGPRGVGVVSLGEVEGGDGIEEPREDGETFEANARLKAGYYAKRLKRVCLADDSGLEVDVLGGRPGVHSAYFAHGVEEGPRVARAERDAANNAKLLKEMEGVEWGRRGARFRCVMALAGSDGRVVAVADGVFEGRIGLEMKGRNGFGYDPLLVLEDGRTSAELSAEEKNARSHRGEAARKIAGEVVRVMGSV